MSLYRYYIEKDQIEKVVTRLLDNLAFMVAARTGREGSALRRQIEILRSYYFAMMREGRFPEELLKCFTLAYDARVGLESLEAVYKGLMAEVRTGNVASAVIRTAVLYCLAAEARIVADMEFTSREDVEAMIIRMRRAFNPARDIAADEMDSASYQSLTYLAGSLTNHLATTARPLPRMVRFTLPMPLPALVASNRIYYDASRSEELIAENKTIHPLFMQRQLRGLSA